MKKFASLILVILVGLFIFTNLYGFTSDEYAFNKFGKANLSDRVSEKIVNKNVNGENDAKVVFKESSNLESGSANLVTSVVVNYRSFDTLGEVTVLFISAIGVALLLGGNKKRKTIKIPSNFILKVGTKVIFGIILMTGVYIFVHGHLTPGGGFPGGSMIASAVLLMYVSDNDFRIKFNNLKIMEGITGSFYVVAGLIGLVIGGYFLYNFLPNGRVGDLLSSGIIPIIYILIGLKVGAELSGIFTNFLAEGVEN